MQLGGVCDVYHLARLLFGDCWLGQFVQNRLNKDFQVLSFPRLFSFGYNTSVTTVHTSDKLGLRFSKKKSCPQIFNLIGCFSC